MRVQDGLSFVYTAFCKVGYSDWHLLRVILKMLNPKKCFQKLCAICRWWWLTALQGCLKTSFERSCALLVSKLQKNIACHEDQMCTGDLLVRVEQISWWICKKAPKCHCEISTGHFADAKAWAKSGAALATYICHAQECIGYIRWDWTFLAIRNICLLGTTKNHGDSHASVYLMSVPLTHVRLSFVFVK